MANDRSVIIVCPAAKRDDANKVLARFFGDPPESTNLSVALIPVNGNAPPTHYTLHIWQESNEASSLSAMPTGGGNLPDFTDGLDWEDDFGITEAQAKAAVGAMTVHVATGGVPTEHLAGILNGHGLKLQPPPEI